MRLSESGTTLPEHPHGFRELGRLIGVERRERVSETGLTYVFERRS